VALALSTYFWLHHPHHLALQVQLICDPSFISAVAAPNPLKGMDFI
jgi:hypothetical protein